MGGEQEMLHFHLSGSSDTKNPRLPGLVSQSGNFLMRVTSGTDSPSQCNVQLVLQKLVNFARVYVQL